MKRIVIVIGALLLESTMNLNAMRQPVCLLKSDAGLVDAFCSTTEHGVRQAMLYIIGKMNEQMPQMRNDIIQTADGFIFPEYAFLYRKYICPCKPVGYQFPMVSDIKEYGYNPLNYHDKLYYPIASCDPTQSCYCVNIYSLVDFEGADLLIRSCREIVEELMPDGDKKRKWLFSNGRIQDYFNKARASIGLESLLSYSLSFDKSGSYPLFRVLCEVRNPGELVSLFTYYYGNIQGVDESVYFDNFCLMRCYFAKYIEDLPSVLNILGRKVRNVLYFDKKTAHSFLKMLRIMSKFSHNHMDIFCKFIDRYNLDNVMRLFCGNSANGDVDVATNEFDSDFASNLIASIMINGNFPKDVLWTVINKKEVRNAFIALLYRQYDGNSVGEIIAEFFNMVIMTANMSFNRRNNAIFGNFFHALSEIALNDPESADIGTCRILFNEAVSVYQD